MPDDNFCQKTRRGSGMKKLKKPLMIAVPLFLVLTAIAAFILFIGSCPAKTIFDNTENFGPFDLRLSYTPDNLMTVISHYGGDRRADYNQYFTFDFILTGCGFFFMFLTPQLINTFSSKHYLLFRSSVFSAVFSAFFNVVENILLIRIVDTSPAFTDSDANLASGCTTLKWIFIGIWIVSTILFAITTTITVMKNRKSSE